MFCRRIFAFFAITSFFIAASAPADEVSFNRAKLVTDDAEAVATRIQLTDLATNEINFAYFIFHEDEAGLLALAQARSAARKAVAAGRPIKIRFLVDGTSHRLSSGMIRHLRDEGIEFRVYHPYFVNEMQRERFEAGSTKDLMAQFKFFDRSRMPVSWIWTRMHDKQIIVDRKLSLMGSRNIQNGYFTDRRFKGFRSHDVDVLVEGPQVAVQSSYFMQIWDSDEVRAFPDFTEIPDSEVRAAAEKLDHFSTILRRWKASESVGSKIRSSLEGMIQVESAEFLSDDILAKRRALRTARSLVDFIDRAKSELIIENPYILLTKDFRRALKAAKKRGVRIIALTNSPGSMDIALVGKTYLRERKALASLGVEIYERTEKGMIHGKVMVADRRWISVSTYNLDPRSRNLNLEIGFNFDSPDLAATYIPRMEAYMKFNHRYDPELDRVELRSFADCLSYLWDSTYLAVIRSQL